MPDFSHNPVNDVLWVPIDKLFANNYNPNFVATTELQLLFVSIDHDGFTMPIVTIHDPEHRGGEFTYWRAAAPNVPCVGTGRYVIVDGFHRHTIPKRYQEIAERNHGCVPIV